MHRLQLRLAVVVPQLGRGSIETLASSEHTSSQLILSRSCRHNVIEALSVHPSRTRCMLAVHLHATTTPQWRLAVHALATAVHLSELLLLVQRHIGLVPS